MNGLNLTWGTTLAELAQADENDFPGPLSRDDLLDCARHLTSSPGMPLRLLTKMLQREEGTWSFCHGCAMNLLRWFPILVVIRRSHTVVLNLHEVVLDEHIVDDLLHLDVSPMSEQPPLAAATAPEPIEVTRPTPGPSKGTGGRVPLHVAVPRIVDAVSSFAELHSFSAQSRWRTDTAMTNKVSLK